MEENNSILENLDPEAVEISQAQRVIINLIDFAIEVAIILGFYFLVPREFILPILARGEYVKYIIAFTILFSYRIILILFFGRTIGMFICKAIFLNDTLQPLSSGQRIIATFAPKISGIKRYKE